jgi:hypothetical protein
MLVFPVFIDAHTHLQMYNVYMDGGRLCSGTPRIGRRHTTVSDFATQDRASVCRRTGAGMHGGRNCSVITDLYGDHRLEREDAAEL